MICPLCENTDIGILEKVKVKDLVRLYYKMTKEDFSYLFEKDEIEYCECNNCKLTFFNPLVTGDEKFYNVFQKFYWYYPDEKEEFSIASKYISEDDRVLEVGSGKGAFVKYLKTKYYIGLDFSEEAKEMASKNGIKIENEIIENYAKKHQGEFDVVCSFQVLEHVLNPKSFIESKLESIKDGGKIIVAVPNDDTFIKYGANGLLNMPPHHVTRWSKETFGFIAKKYNLDLKIVTEKVQPYHKEWYISTFIRTILFGKEKLIETSLVKRAIVKFIKTVLYKKLRENFKNEFLPDGMVMIGIFTKKER